MKNNKSLITGISLCLLFLAGCGQTVSNQEASINPLNTKTAASTEPNTNISATDKAAFDGAVQLKDEEFCNKIIDKNYKMECVTKLQDLQYLSEAISKLDSQICSKISNLDQQNACKISVEVGQKEAEKSQAFSSEVEKGNQIVAGGDYSQCAKQLTNKTLISSCELNILSAKALETKDATLCNKISLPQDQVRCKSGLK